MSKHDAPASTNDIYKIRFLGGIKDNKIWKLVADTEDYSSDDFNTGTEFSIPSSYQWQQAGLPPAQCKRGSAMVCS